jgi:hypothetical protein
MPLMTGWTVTANLGGKFSTDAVKAGSVRWAQQAIERRPLVVFAQEVPSASWLKVWSAAGYEVALGGPPSWAVQSAVITDRRLTVEPVSVGEFPNLGYHGSYVAAVRWSSSRGDVLLASVHASPNPAEPERYDWVGDLPAARSGGGDSRYVGNTLWDSDLVLHTLSEMARTGGAVLAAGDFNEARAFDIAADGTRLGTWGQEYFDRVASCGFVAWASENWGERSVPPATAYSWTTWWSHEVPTYCNANRPRLSRTGRRESLSARTTPLFGWR